jgi:2-polyprenyl-3-methyl-5-hydroxy-6-metoxy-1,4-benzoquinol methylase
MNSKPFSDTKIVESWGKNALPWTAAVREGQIESRKQITDQAIIDAILRYLPLSVLDIGCGEGWLARELAARNVHVVGTDVVPKLVEEARRAGGGDFHMLSYEKIAAGKLRISVDVVACNFALLGKESVEGIFRAVPSLLNKNGRFVVQTLHPVMACGDFPYRDRKQGIGTMLLEKAAEFAKEAEAIRLNLSTAITNRAAQSLYEEAGWVRDQDYYVYNLKFSA